MADNASDQGKKKDSGKKDKDIVPQTEAAEKSSTADLIAELPDDMPPEMKRTISMGMMQTSHQGGISRSHPLFKGMMITNIIFGVPIDGLPSYTH